MIDWILQNKEWVFSGAGILVVTGVFSFLSVVMTLWLKSRSERKKKRRLQLLEKLVKFEIPHAEKSIDGGLLLVSYKAKEYKHLCHYSVFIENSGSSSIENQNLLFSFPKEASVLEKLVEPSSSLINISSEELNNTNEILYRVDRLEQSESITISILINAEDPESIKCTPRGVDNIDYIWGKSGSTSDIEILVLLMAVFIFSDAVPLISSILQGFIVLASAPLIIRMARTFINSRKMHGNSVTIIGGVKTSDDGVVNISQSSSNPKD